MPICARHWSGLTAAPLRSTGQGEAPDGPRQAAAQQEQGAGRARRRSPRLLRSRHWPRWGRIQWQICHRLLPYLTDLADHSGTPAARMRVEQLLAKLRIDEWSPVARDRVGEPELGLAPHHVGGDGARLVELGPVPASDAVWDWVGRG